MQKLRNTLVRRRPAGHRSPFGGSYYMKGRHMQHVEADSTYWPEDDEGDITLSHTITAGRGVAVISTKIGHKDFVVLIDEMTQAHPEAAIRAIGVALAKFRQAKD